jgi:hypothetical protein
MPLIQCGTMSEIGRVIEGSRRNCHAPSTVSFSKKS